MLELARLHIPLWELPPPSWWRSLCVTLGAMLSRFNSSWGLRGLKLALRTGARLRAIHSEWIERMWILECFKCLSLNLLSTNYFFCDCVVTAPLCAVHFLKESTHQPPPHVQTCGAIHSIFICSYHAFCVSLVSSRWELYSMSHIQKFAFETNSVIYLLNLSSNTTGMGAVKTRDDTHHLDITPS